MLVETWGLGLIRRSRLGSLLFDLRKRITSVIDWGLRAFTCPMVCVLGPTLGGTSQDHDGGRMHAFSTASWEPEPIGRLSAVVAKQGTHTEQPTSKGLVLHRTKCNYCQLLRIRGSYLRWNPVMPAGTTGLGGLGCGSSNTPGVREDTRWMSES